MERNTCIAMVPCPGLSHLIQFVEFSKQLVLYHQNLNITFFIPTLGPPAPSIKALLTTLPPNITFTILPQINMQDLPNNILLATQMKLTVKHSLPFLHQEITSLTSRTHLAAFICDFFSSDALQIAKDFNLSSYFCTSSATSLSFCFSLPKLHHNLTSEFITDSLQTVDFPGCGVPLNVKDLADPVLLGRSTQTYKSFLNACESLSSADGLIVNSFTELEAEAIGAMNMNSTFVYPIGPLIQTESTNQLNESECMRWLENQPPKSVLFVSFGSGGTLSHKQLSELALGLEMSRHKFLWVVRVPSQASSSAYFSGQKDDPFEYLPRGFLDRTKGKGLVVPLWAPQVDILGHVSTGGFLTHCGWSSILEGVVNGVPMIAWPLFAEQRMNAAMLANVLEVAVRPKIDESDVVRREEVARVIKMVMEGNESLQMRKRIESFSAEAANALSEHGSSKKVLSSLVMKWQS
ncbi:hypothetical protein VNO77_08992 [Canavalia gladiata]|uniref:Glycosyltransferase n=1 Tax=Canavalia gladiata TaxID=3824 RepID=A0AAN9M8V6_CANGL